MEGGEGFDLCECIYSHEASMRRLLTLLREGQSYCTDTECTDGGPLSDMPAPNPSSTYYMLALWAILALVLFLMRPMSMRRTGRESEGGQKPTAIGNNNNNNQPPPPPPPVE